LIPSFSPFDHAGEMKLYAAADRFRPELEREQLGTFAPE